MNGKLSIIALALLSGVVMAAPERVWSITEGNGKTIHPYGKWYTYTYSESGSAAKIDTATTATAKVITASVGRTISSSAGVGFGWGAKQDSIKDLSIYEGVCLTYAAEAAFRLDFKQTTVKDGNYNGYNVPAQASIDTIFIPFSELAQEKGWGVTRALDLTKQTGVQFSYKQSFVETEGVLKNVIKIAAIHFGSSCSSHAPNLKTGVTSPDSKTLYEGDTLKIGFKEIFEDADGDDLNITMSMSGDIVDLKEAKSYSMSDFAWLKSKPNPASGASATVSFQATDPTGKSVSYTVKVSLVDRQNPPVAVNDNYTVDEDSKLTVSAAKGVLRNDYDDDDDPDNPSITATLDSTTQHGVLTFSGSGFTYTPEADFYGTDYFVYHVTDGSGNTSNMATVTITVNNVEDPATLTINHPFLYVGSLDEDAVNFEDGVKVKEDFDDFDIFIPGENIEFSDPDVLTAGFPLKVACAKGLVEVAYTKISGNHVISVTAVPNANGKDVIKLFTIDGKDTVGISIPVEVAAVADKPVAKNDAYEMGQDTVNVVSAKLGVLANDVNPDGASVLKAYLFEDADHGKVKLATDGSFTYEVGDFNGEDIFTYFVVNAEGDTSEVAAVTLTVEYRNRGPVVLAAARDTAGARVAALNEDFAKTIEFKASEVKTWFEDPEGDPISFRASNPDSLLNVTSTVAGTITVKAVRDACGETTLDVIATDSANNSTTFSLPVSIDCVNDVPVRIGAAADTILVPPSGWRKAFYVFDLFEDVDDTVLTLKVTTLNKERVIKGEVIGDSLIVNLFDDKVYLQKKVPYSIKVNVTDGMGKTAVPKTLVFLVDESMALPQVASASKMGWQGAIRAEQGVAAIFDMQGRVMWKSALPVSEADVRNAAAKVQGRKILQVNKQTWTIK
ncbi:MAG: tandem-95 repeat protein [Fibrobacter sp.]|uniref:Ig-like domain-containing protein n=1 Tax=Fibrobacter sp. TaxID=35828 RepID=UPI0025BDEB0C|nr:Ig-like domain-containing protein [Fibrobacter sp.]MBR4785018.1 tandem-95 repeat protein [Fibrobacter sp.]